MPTDLHDLETRLWSAADQLWANTKLKAYEFCGLVLWFACQRYVEPRSREVKTENGSFLTWG